MKSTQETVPEGNSPRIPKVQNANREGVNPRGGSQRDDLQVDYGPMATTTVSTPSTKRSTKNTLEEPHYSDILKQLEKIISSAHFRNSKRYPTFLKFVVEHTLAGRVEVLKERTLGVEVFGRPSDYDTNADPVVRVTAGEIRKRIAQYYRSDGHEHELRIELPVGSYVPEFFSPSAEHAPPELSEREESAQVVQNDLRQPAQPIPASTEDPIPIEEVFHPGRLTARTRLGSFLVAALVLLATVSAAAVFGARLWRGHPAEKGIDYFWKPILASDSPALIVVGVHSLDENGKDLPPRTHMGSPSETEENMLSSMIYSDMVPVSDIISYSALTKLLTERGHAYRTQGASETTFEQLQRGPVVLVGGLDNVWTLRLTSTLRYRFDPPGTMINEIVDSEHPATTWHFDNGQSAVSNSRDYAIVASFFDTRIEQRVVIAAGIGKSGTAAAAEFLTTDSYLQSWLAQAKLSKSKNVEIVLSTEIVEGQQGPPQVIASYSW